MNVDELISGLAVSDFATARGWYARFFDRSADVIANDVEHLWQLTDQGWLYIVRGPANAGHGIAALAVADLKTVIAELNGRGVETGSITREATDAHKSVAHDPDGNSIALVGPIVARARRWEDCRMNDTQLSGVRLTELLAAMSLGTDLGMGHPMEHVLRQSFLALRLAERLGLAASEREVVYYSSLMAWVGCHIDAYEQAKWFGDDRALKHEIRWIDEGQAVQGAAFVVRHLGAGKPWVERARLAAGFVGDGRRVLADITENHWRTADALMERLCLSPVVRSSVSQTFERWDGKGGPEGTAGEQLELPSRLVNLADVVEVFHQAGGIEAAVAVARQRRGTQFDPALVDLFCDDAEALFAELESVTSWEALMAAEPRLDRQLDERELDIALEAVADFVDLKSPFTIGHSRSVAELAGEAASHLDLPAGDVTTVRRAALVQDVGRLGVSNAVWDKQGPLTRAEVERVRLHPYLTERMLASTPVLAGLADLAVQHHERLDGSGYPRGIKGVAITTGGRILAAADMYRSKLEPRPHRPAMPPGDVATSMRDEARAGRLDGDAVEGVLRAAGHRARRRREWPAGLTAREVEVLRLVARGLSHKQIAEKLVISRKTASHHVEHIYAKIGVSNRAMAALFAMKYGLMDNDARATEPADS